MRPVFGEGRIVNAVLQVNGLTKSYGSVVANNGVELVVNQGEVVGLLGHNGAGKTTLVLQVMGLLMPDAGTIRVGAVDAVADPAAARRCVALMAQAQTPIDGLTPRTAIALAARLRGLDKRTAKHAAEELAAKLAIEPWLDRRAGPEGTGLSGGVRRLTGFAMAVVAPTPLVILDEPTNDIDPARRRRLWELVRRAADRGAGVLLVTHNVSEAERAVDRLVIMDEGRVVAAGTPQQLRGTEDHLRLELITEPEGDPSAIVPPFDCLRDVVVGRRRLLTFAAAEAERAIQWASTIRSHGACESFALTPTSLEELYLELTESKSRKSEPEEVTARG